MPETVLSHLYKQRMMLLRTPQMLKSGIDKGNTMNYLALVFRIVHVCVEKQSAVKAQDANGAYTHCGQLKEYPKFLNPPKNRFIFRADTNSFLFILFLKI